MSQNNKIEKAEKSQGEQKTAFVVLFSALIMVLEIIFGLYSKSMALLADGIHMGSHVLAIGLIGELKYWCVISGKNSQTI